MTLQGFLLETTAGQGSSIGRSFEELAYILDRTKDRLPIEFALILAIFLQQVMTSALQQLGSKH